MRNGISKSLVARLGGRYRELKFRLLGLPLHNIPIYEPRTSDLWTPEDSLQYLRQTVALKTDIVALLDQFSDLRQPVQPLSQIMREMAHLSPELREVVYQKSSHDMVKNFAVQSGSNTITHILNVTKAPGFNERIIRDLVEFQYAPPDHAAIQLWIYTLLGNLRHHRGTELSTNTANDIIGFALANNDLHLADLTLSLLKISSSHRPDRTSYHQYLRYGAQRISKNAYPQGIVAHPLMSTLKHLRDMRTEGLKADSMTWNLVMQNMPFGFGKSLILEEMDRRNIQLDEMSREALLKTVLDSDREAEITDRLVSSLDADIPVARRLYVGKLLRRSLQKSESEYAKETTDNEHMHPGADSQSSRKEKKYRSIPPSLNEAWQALKESKDTSVEMMHIVLREFSPVRRLDWQLGSLGHFAGTRWDPVTWQFLLGTAIQLPERAATKPTLLGTLLMETQREDVPLTPRSRVLARNIVRRYKDQLRDIGATNWKELVNGLAWDEAEPKPRDPHLLSTLGLETGVPRFMSQPAQIDPTRFMRMPPTNSKSWRRTVDILLESKKSVNCHP